MRIEGCSNGALDFTGATASGSRITGWITASSGEAVKGTPSSSVQLDVALRGGIALGATPSCPSIASATEIELPNRWYTILVTTKVTGSAEIKKIKAAAAGSILVLIFTAGAKMVDGENLKLKEGLHRHGGRHDDPRLRRDQLVRDRPQGAPTDDAARQIPPAWSAKTLFPSK